MNSLGLCGLLLVATTAFAASAAQQSSAPAEPKPIVVHHEHVLGTTLQIELRCDADAAKAAEAAVLAEIRRLESILSTYDASSELSKLTKSAGPRSASPELRAVLAACERWRTETKSAFHAGVAIFTNLWKDAASRGAAPSQEAIEAARALLPERLWAIDEEHGTAAALTDLPVSVDALAKGFIVERAAAAAARAGAASARVAIGGDMRAVGKSAFEVEVLDPAATAENAKPICKVRLCDAAIATSGGYARGFDIGGVHYSHIFDPRTGRPATALWQSTVIAADAATADALATIVYVLGPKEGLALVEATPKAAALLVDRDGARIESRGWKSWLVPEPEETRAERSAWPDGGSVSLSFDLQQITTSGRGKRGGYRRPYVAAWVETPDGNAVRTLCLWIEKPKWIDDLRRWSRLYASKREEVRAMTRATRAPGHYELSWDGRDDHGAAVPYGNYQLFLEVVREHGTYQIAKFELAVDGKPFEKQGEGGTEMGPPTVVYRTGKAEK